MASRRRFAAACLGTIAALGLAACGNEEDVTARVTAGSATMGILRFPTDWSTVEGSAEPIVYYGRLHARQSLGQSGELLLAMASDSGIVARQRYAVSTDGSFRLRPVSEADWNAAAPLDVRLVDGVTHRPSDLASFRVSGETWVAAASVPNARATAVVSATEVERPPEGFPIGSARRYRGTLYLDLFERDNSTRIAAAEADYRDPDLLRQAAWIASRAFFMPLDPQARLCLLAILPEG